MLRRAVWVVAALIACGFSQKALATPAANIRAAGNAQLLIIDANQNGMLGDADDCIVGATANGSNLTIRGTQSTSASTRLVLCSDPGNTSKDHGSCWGSGFVSADFAEADIANCDYAGAPFVPISAEFCMSLDSCLSDSSFAHSAGAAGQAEGPVSITAGAVFQTTFTTPLRSGFGQICNAGGPTAQITGDDGITVLRELRPFPNGDSPTHMCVDNVPVQLLLGGKVFRTACFPVNSDMTTPLTVEDGAPFVVIDFNTLAGCGAVRGAPTMSEWGLIALMAGLLATGTWALGRRRSFYESLPQA
jgi:hypothetical protein